MSHWINQDKDQIESAHLFFPESDSLEDLHSFEKRNPVG